MERIKRLITTILAVTLLVSVIEAMGLSANESDENMIPELDCIIEPSEIVDVGSAVPGVVESIGADRNDLIAKGSVIAELESSVENATLELSRERASLNTAIELRQESARFGHLTKKRNQSLLQAAAISKHDMDTVVSETRIAELQVRQERDNKRIAGLELLRARAVLDRRIIRSPVDGVVVDRFKSAGEYIDDEPLLRVAQLNPLHVEVIVSTDYLGRIEPGMQAEVTPSVPVANNYLATVERVDRVSDAASGTYGVRLSLANPDYTIPAGLRCRLGFIPQLHAETAEVAEVSEVGELTKATETAEAAETAEVVEAAEATEVKEVEKTAEVAADIPVKEIDQVILAADPPATESSEQAVAAVESAAISDSTVSTAQFIPDAESAQVSQKAQPGSCHTIGPFTRESIARRWFEGLHEVSENLTLRNETESVEEDFIVFASVEPSPKALESLIDRLDRAGITDRYFFRSGVRKGSVSLGVYRDHAYAVKRQKKLAAKGFVSEIEARSKVGKHFWLDISLATGADLPKWIAQLPTNSSAKSVICSEQFAQR